MKKKLIVALAATAILIGSLFAFAACKDKEISKGFDIEAAKAAGEYLGIEVRFQKIDWDSKEIELNGKNIDLIWNGLTISDERKETMELSLPYMANKQVAVVRASDVASFDTREKIAAAKVVAEKGSAGESVAQEILAASKYTQIKDQITCLTEVRAGSSDVAIIDSVMAGYYTGSDESGYKGKLAIVPDMVFTEEYYGIAARKGAKGTISKINEALAALKANGKLKEIAEKYGLASELVDIEYASDYDSLTAEEKADWESIVAKGYVVIGYTVYAPIAY